MSEFNIVFAWVGKIYLAASLALEMTKRWEKGQIMMRRSTDEQAVKVMDETQIELTRGDDGTVFVSPNPSPLL